jgi:hypothetical protein
MKKQLTLEQFKSGVKFKIKNQYDPEKLSNETYQYKCVDYGDGFTIESVDTLGPINYGGGNIEKATKSAFTVYSYMLEQKVRVRVKFADCVVVEDEN